MKIELKNATLLPMNGEFSVIERGTVQVENGRIVAVGKGRKDFIPERVIDCKEDVVMPAFVNAHTHSAMTLFRGLADDLPLDEWLFSRIFPLEKNLTEEDVYWGTMLAALEYAGGGVTTCGEMYFFPESVAKAADKSGLRFAMTGGATDFGGQAEESAENEERNFLAYNGKSEQFKYIMGAHSEYLTTEDLISRLVALSAKYRAPLYTHLSETLKEVGECTVRNGGLTPPLYLHRMGFFDRGASVAHGVYCDKDDIAVLAEAGVSVVTNPASNLKLASGIAPLSEMKRRGVNLALGTDGAASNNALDLFREMYLASVLQKSEMKDAAAMPAEEVLRMATVNGAKALFYENLGVLKPGNCADLIRVSLDAPQMHPRNCVTKHLAYSAAKSDVKLTMCAGKIVYEDGEYFLGEKPEEIYRRAEESIKRLTKMAE